jgi:hypothetical protein
VLYKKEKRKTYSIHFLFTLVSFHHLPSSLLHQMCVSDSEDEQQEKEAPPPKKQATPKASGPAKTGAGKSAAKPTAAAAKAGAAQSGSKRGRAETETVDLEVTLRWAVSKRQHLVAVMCWA